MSSLGTFATSQEGGSTSAFGGNSDIEQAHEAQLAERMQRFEDRLVSRLSELKGYQAVREYFGANGHADPQQSEVTDPTALHVRQAREAKGLSQQQLADMAQVSKSQIQRIETTGRVKYGKAKLRPDASLLQ
jgi:ribosome-binding protein aMBF1 (putative translation factor)